MSDLTKISWAHAVNSEAELQAALDNDTIDMLEADIILGQINNSGTNLPVMGHPPMKSSDIALNDFLLRIVDYNSNSITSKGVKLDFKSIEVFEASIDILDKIWKKIQFPIWLNADIVKGPVNQTKTIPVEPNRFLNACTKYKNAILSIGWTTLWGPSYYDGGYTDLEIADMIAVIRNNNIVNRIITFPVRAGIAANSSHQMVNLFKEISLQNECTFTVWSSPYDFVNISKLKQFILEFGLDKVYLDVPTDIRDQLNL